MPSFSNRELGSFDYEEKHIISFPEGIIGFEDMRNYIIINDEDSEPIQWLVSLDDHDLMFPVLDPSLVRREYTGLLPPGPDRTVLLIASLKESPEDSTVNLRSPIVIDAETRTGRQVVLADESLPMRYRFLEAPQGMKE
jgi:flagellar assembly factor FliW